MVPWIIPLIEKNPFSLSLFIFIPIPVLLTFGTFKLVFIGLIFVFIPGRFDCIFVLILGIFVFTLGIAPLTSKLVEGNPIVGFVTFILGRLLFKLLSGIFTPIWLLVFKFGILLFILISGFCEGKLTFPSNLIPPSGILIPVPIPFILVLRGLFIWVLITTPDGLGNCPKLPPTFAFNIAGFVSFLPTIIPLMQNSPNSISCMPKFKLAPVWGKPIFCAFRLVSIFGIFKLVLTLGILALGIFRLVLTLGILAFCKFRLVSILGILVLGIFKLAPILAFPPRL